jgi:hypothetical protein
MKNWRSYATPIIVQVLKDTAGKSEKEIMRALLDAYPFGERKYHPYKIWLDEIKVRRGKKTFGRKAKDPDPNQTTLIL